jgi:peroxiredoxin (alkyl hydroperoxide reductase subunit C)
VISTNSPCLKAVAANGLISVLIMWSYSMVGDQTGTITNNFGVMREGQGLADRATFLVDPQGVIQAMEITAEGIGRDADDLMRKVKAAQYVAAHPGEVCPAKWKEGEATLAPSLDLVGKI